MDCPFCYHHGSNVLESRKATDGDRSFTFRRRRCPECKERFSTKEYHCARNYFRAMKNRSPRGRNAGVKHGCAVLLPENIYEIRRLADEGMTRIKIAEKFGISRGHAGDIAGRRSWKHLPERKGRSNNSTKMSFEETLP